MTRTITQGFAAFGLAAGLFGAVAAMGPASAQTLPSQGFASVQAAADDMRPHSHRDHYRLTTVQTDGGDMTSRKYLERSGATGGGGQGG